MIVIFDTSAISKIYATNAMYGSLCDLAVAKKIEIHIPYVVKREIETQRINEVENQFNKVMTELKKLNKITGKNHKVSDILTNYENCRSKIIRDLETDNDLYFYALRAIIQEVDADQAKNALEAYFCGNKPLTNPKNREDIPDSFICQSIYSIFENYSDKGKKFIIIASDRKVFNTFKDDDRCLIHQSLEKFFQSDEVKKYLKEIYFEFNQSPMEFFIKHKQDSINRDLSFLSNFSELILNKHLDYFPYSNDDTAIIADTIGFADFDIDFENPIILGKNKMGFKFSATDICTLDFYIDKPDYYAIFGDFLEILDDINHYVYLVRGDFEIQVTGLCSVEVDFKDAFIDKVKNNSMNLAEYLDNKEFEMICNIENIDTINFLDNRGENDNPIPTF